MIKFIIPLLFMVPVKAENNYKIVVAILDTGLNTFAAVHNKICGSYNYTKEPNVDLHGHGSNVAGLIVKNATSAEYCIKSYKSFAVTKPFSQEEKTSFYHQSLREALEAKPTIVNISAGGVGADDEERSLIIQMLDAGIIVVAAAGNESSDLGKDCNYFPACIDKRIIVVGNGNGTANLDSKTNYNGPVDIYVDGQLQDGFGITLSGSSQATAIVTAKIIDMMKIGDKTYKKWME